MYKIIFDCSLFCTHFEKQERKAKELILRFSALLIILQGYALGDFTNDCFYLLSCYHLATFLLPSCYLLPTHYFVFTKRIFSTQFITNSELSIFKFQVSIQNCINIRFLEPTFSLPPCYPLTIPLLPPT